MLSSVEQAFLGRDEKRAPLKTPAWEAMVFKATINQSKVALVHPNDPTNRFTKNVYPFPLRLSTDE